MSRILIQSFFNRDARIVARELLGKRLVRKYRGKKIEGFITETEAYVGPDDKASHASRGLTPRNKVMFGYPGILYVYFTYGMHWMLNVVTREKGYPAAVLIRGTDVVSGPARLTKHFKIDGKLNGIRAGKNSGLWLAAPGGRALASRTRRSGSLPKGAGRLKIKKTPRIGVEYAGPVWAKKRYRYVLEK